MLSLSAFVRGAVVVGVGFVGGFAGIGAAAAGGLGAAVFGALGAFLYAGFLADLIRDRRRQLRERAAVVAEIRARHAAGQPITFYEAKVAGIG